MPNVSTAQYGAGLSLFVPAIRALVEGGRTISINPGHREQWDRRPAWHGTVYGNGRPGTGRERVVPAGVMIDSSTPNVQLKNRDGIPKIPSAGAEFFMLYIEETYTGKGSSNTMFLLGGSHAFGGHHHEDRSNACGPGSGPSQNPTCNRTTEVTGSTPERRSPATSASRSPPATRHRSSCTCALTPHRSSSGSRCTNQAGAAVGAVHVASGNIPEHWP